MSTTINLPDVNIHNRALVTADSADEVLIADASDNFRLKKTLVSSIAASGGAGDVDGPASSTDNAIARFDGTTGKIIQNSVVTVADATGNIAGAGTISSGEITSSSLTASRLLVSGALKEIQSTAVTTTEAGYLSGVTSAIQTQLNSAKNGSITLSLDGNGAAPTVGFKRWTTVPYACTINSVTMTADVSGSIVIDIWKDAYANFPPTVADSITAAAKPTISSAIKSVDSTLTGWTTSVAAGDVLMFNVDSASTLTTLDLVLKVTKT